MTAARPALKRTFVCPLLQHAITRGVHTPRQGDIVWIDRRDDGEVALHVAPSHLGEEIRRGLVEPHRSAVFTSATLAVSGLIPASIFAAAPRLAPNSALLAITLGLMMNGSNMGQLLGPAVLAAFVQRFGWESAPLVFAGVMIAGFAIALTLRAVLRRPAP